MSVYEIHMFVIAIITLIVAIISMIVEIYIAWMTYMDARKNRPSAE